MHDVNVLKWSHSIVNEENFINEWAAIENARSLAFDLGTYNGIFPLDMRLSTVSAKAISSHRRLGFAPDVDVLIGMEDELTMYRTVVSDICLGTGSMPWRQGLLRGGTYQPFSSEELPDSWDNLFQDEETSKWNWTASHRDPPVLQAPRHDPTSTSNTIHSPDPSHPTDRDMTRSLRVSNPIPRWGHDLLALLEQEGQEDDDEEGLVVFVSSFYIDHERVLFHDESRILRFDNDYNEWENSIRFIWEDMVDPNVPIEVVIVRPEPPQHPHRGTMATVIVHQNLRPDRAACLVTAVHIMDPTTTFQHTAHSMELQMSPARIFQLARVDQICQQRQRQGAGRCTLHIGHHRHLDHQFVATSHGLGMHIRIPTTLTDFEAEQNLLRRIQQQRRGRRGDPWDPADHQDIPPENTHPPIDPSSAHPEDEVSFMGRRPRRLHSIVEVSSSTSPETISSTESSTDWRQTVIFTLDGMSTSAQLPWHDMDLLYEQAAVALELNRRDILRVQAVHRPLDYIQVNLYGMILQRAHEFRPNPYVRLTLVDMELHVANEIQSSPFRRYPKWLPYVADREALVQTLGLESLCSTQESPCHIWRNNVILDTDPRTRLHISDGDYIKVYVGDIDNLDICLSDIDIESPEEQLESSPRNEDEEETALFQRAAIALQKACSDTCVALQSAQPQPAAEHVISTRRLQVNTWRIAPQHERSGPPIGSYPQGVPPPPQRAFNAQLHFDDRRLFAHLFATTSIIECEDEGPIAYIETWYIHHQIHRRCTEPRSVRIRHDSPSWIEDIIEPWATTLVPDLEVTIHLVKPQPPRTNMECIMAHLILEQSTRVAHTVGMVSTMMSETHRGPFHHSAYSLPDIMNQAYVLRQAGLQEVCRDGRCRVRLGNIPFGLFDWDEFPRASSLTIHREQFSFSSHADSHEVLDLMQRTTMRWRRRGTDQHGFERTTTRRWMSQLCLQSSCNAI